MSILDKKVSSDDKLYFIEGFYEDHFLINIGETTKEVKIPYNLLMVLKNSYGESATIADSIEAIMPKEIVEDKELLFNEARVLLKQVLLLQDKGVINLV